MAIIKCPECGQDVSDKAMTCIHCGCPLQINKTVKIILQDMKYAAGFFGKPTSYDVNITCDGTEIWKGTSNLVASFDVDGEKTISINYSTQHPIKAVRASAAFSFVCTVKSGKKYKMENVQRGGFKASSAKWALDEVEVINGIN